MSKINPGKFPKLVVTLLLVLAGIGATWLLADRINARINNAIHPLLEAKNELSTQVADLLHPTPTVIPDPVTIINKVQSLARLETIRYNVEKVITAETGQGTFAFLIQDRLLLVAHGLVIAGIDMGRMEAEDLELNQGVLNVRMPEAEVFVASLDNEKTYVYDRDTGLLKKPDPNLETVARQAAEQEILKAALEDGILDQALINARVTLRWFFETLGYRQIKFVEARP